MIELDVLDIAPPERTIQTPTIAKPEPTSDPLYPSKIDTILSERFPNGDTKALSEQYYFPAATTPAHSLTTFAT